MPDIFKKVGVFFLDTVETIVIALAIFVVVYLFIVQLHQVKGSSMFPNFVDGELILTDKVSYRLGKPQRGDVIVFKSPKDHEVDYIKRIIGIAGDTVKISNDKVFLNNNQLEEKYLPSEYVTNPGVFARSDEDILVSDGEYFVLGDNRGHSSDSREWGFVKTDEIIGKAWIRFWPLSNFGFVPHVKI